MRLFDLILAYPAYAYFVIISAVALALTVYDKVISKRPGKRRISEAALLLVSALGGSVAMYATMLFIRHKTKHPKFMIGIPVIMVLQAAAIVFVSMKF